MSDYVVTFEVDRGGESERHIYTVTDVPSRDVAIVVAAGNAGVAVANKTTEGRVIDADALRLFGTPGYVFSYFTRAQGGELIASFIPATTDDTKEYVLRRIIAAIPSIYRISALHPYKLGSA